MFAQGASELNRDFDLTEYRQYITRNFVTEINYGEHLMVRMENIDKQESNSVYLTFFRIRRMTRKVKLECLVLNHFLRRVVYDVLRNKHNLGYVAHSGLKTYYHVRLQERWLDRDDPRGKLQAQWH